MRRNSSTAMALAFAGALISGAAGAQTAPETEPSAEERRLALLERLKVSGYVQAQYVNVDGDDDVLLPDGGSRNRDQFSVRRGRLKFTYRASELSRVVFAVDASSGGTSLKDGYIELIEPWTSWKNTLTAGQFNWPFGFEVGYSSADREVPEHSRVIRTLFPNEYDRGAMLSGGRDRFDYRLAVVNGGGTANSSDLESDKDLVGRLGMKLGAINVGVSCYEGDALIATAAAPEGQLFDRTRWGVDAQATTPIPGLRVRGEWIQGEQLGSDVRGWYFYLVQNVGTRHQFAARLDEYDPNLDADGDAILTPTLAYSFFWDSNTKVMLAVEDPRRERNDPEDRALTARVQYKF